MERGGDARETRVWTQAPQEPGSDALKKCLEVWPPSVGTCYSFADVSQKVWVRQHRFVSPACCRQIRASAIKRRPLDDGKTTIIHDIDMSDRSKVQGALERVRTPVILCHTTVSAHPSYICPYTTWGLRSGESVCVYHMYIQAYVHVFISIYIRRTSEDEQPRTAFRASRSRMPIPSSSTWWESGT